MFFGFQVAGFQTPTVVFNLGESHLWFNSWKKLKFQGDRAEERRLWELEVEKRLQQRLQEEGGRPRENSLQQPRGIAFEEPIFLPQARHIASEEPIFSAHARNITYETPNFAEVFEEPIFNRNFSATSQVNIAGDATTMQQRGGFENSETLWEDYWSLNAATWSREPFEKPKRYKC